MIQRTIFDLPDIEDLEPSEDTILWRYTDLTYLYTILREEKLPLISMRCLSDPFEGELLRLSLDNFPSATNKTKDFIFDIYKKTIYMSCWCKYEQELAPMWDRFSSKDGIAIKTTAKRLIESIQNSDRISIKPIEYLSNVSEIIPSFINLSALGSDNFLYFNRYERGLCCYKLLDYEDEREVRVVLSKAPFNMHELLISKNLKDYGVNNIVEGIEIKDIEKWDIVSMENIIDEIIISPEARPEIKNIIKDMISFVNQERTIKGSPELDIKINDSRRKKWY